jgi:hypothetical protein
MSTSREVDGLIASLSAQRARQRLSVVPARIKSPCGTLLRRYLLEDFRLFSETLF